ncbi:hypothetical protein BU24DRAFT_86641 [Aaosphaeria arxii CBS 175.79]|uniref:Secreted protein n=1 Tax=Aaosphaeria arxii CBS 175.79 TaxID=1450172 RepID=A0A6A5X8Q5_9PLEO|nr:uncharacterized protein BU24DRAFT_86641 [Aaosphaeria arxii CBS 175.79]KAF2009290.1 hypothetical protein BU24DRAFT_86641 [Aaosphaeria arxii CBS 175.79]
MACTMLVLVACPVSHSSQPTRHTRHGNHRTRRRCAPPYALVHQHIRVHGQLAHPSRKESNEGSSRFSNNRSSLPQ